ICREYLTDEITSLTRCEPDMPRRWMPFRAVDWVVRSLWAHLPTEKNKNVRYDLLRMGARLLTRSPFKHSNHSRGFVATNAMLCILEQEPGPATRELALDLLCDT
ncbi:hypothetical protein PENTCL1PPCAC_7921, partial [Pristionchus entomophagus]